MKKLLILSICLISCRELYTLTYKTQCSRGNMAYYFSNKGVEYTVVAGCDTFEYGKRVSKEWILKHNK